MGFLMSNIEQAQAPGIEKGYIVWNGKKPYKKTALMVSIYGKEHFFAQRGNGWVAKVNLNDPIVQRALKNPHNLVTRLDEGSLHNSIEQMLCDMDTDAIIALIYNTNANEWLLQAYSKFIELEQNQLADAVQTRLKQKGLDVDGMPLAKEEKNEPKTKKAKRVAKTSEGAGEGTQDVAETPAVPDEEPSFD